MIIPEYPSSGQPLSALWARRMVDCVRELAGARKLGAPQNAIEQDVLGLVCASVPFGYTRTAKNKVTIRPGTVRWAGRGDYPVAETPVTISSLDMEQPDWVFVGFQIRPSIEAPAVGVLGSEPTSDPNTLRIPLFTFVLATVDGPVMRMDICRLFDILIASPIG